MDGDTSGIPADFLQDLDLWLLQGGVASPAMNRRSTDLEAMNAGLPSLETPLLTPPDAVPGPAKSNSAESFVAALTDGSLPWEAFQTTSSIESGSISVPPPAPKPQAPQRAVKAAGTKITRPRKGRPPAATASSSEPPKKKGKTNKSTSQRQKEELTYLRQKAEELDTELTTLKQRHREELERQKREEEQKGLAGDAASTAMVTRSLDEMQPQPEVSLWERIAKRQREEKAKAGVENVKLREMVQSQMRLVKSFERLLRKRRIWDQLQENSSNQEGEESRNEEEVLDDMLREVEARYPQIDAVLEEHGLGELDPAVDAGDDENMKYSPVNGMYLEYKEKKFMPFDYKVMDDVVWRSLGEGKLKLEDGELTTLKSTAESIYSKTSLPLSRKGSSSIEIKDAGNSVALTVMKRFVEEGRVVYVWCANTSVKRPGDSGTSPVLLAQKGYAVIGAATLPDGSSGSVIQSYTSSVPTLSTAPSEEDSEQQQAQHREVGLLTELVFTAYQQCRQSINQTLENLVLDEMMAKNAASTPTTSTADTHASI